MYFPNIFRSIQNSFYILKYFQNKFWFRSFAVFNVGDYLFSKDIHTTKMTGYHDFNTR